METTKADKRLIWGMFIGVGAMVAGSYGYNKYKAWKAAKAAAEEQNVEKSSGGGGGGGYMSDETQSQPDATTSKPTNIFSAIFKKPTQNTALTPVARPVNSPIPRPTPTYKPVNVNPVPTIQPVKRLSIKLPVTNTQFDGTYSDTEMFNEMEKRTL